MHNYRTPRWNMRIASAALAVVCGLPGTVVSPAYAENSQNVDQRSDTWISAKLSTAIVLNRHLNPFEIGTDVDNGVVRLTGTVDESVDKDLAEAIAKGIDGVKEVKNEIVVSSNFDDFERGKSRSRMSNKAGERDFFQYVGDATTSASIKSKLLWNRNVAGADIDVDVKNGVAILKGTVATQAEKELAERIARDTDGVHKVDNMLVAKVSNGGIDAERMQQNAEGALKDVSSDVSDAWITTKVRSSLLFSRGVSSDDISVHTKNGAVTLDGTVRYGAEKDLAEKITQEVKGVKGVSNNISVRSAENS